MERRILDFGVNDTFESVAERWSIHFPTSISSNLVRRVVDRVGLRCEAAYSDEALQIACREKPAEPPSMLTVATDGSMLLTREANWKEVKVGVVARGGFIPPGGERPRRRVEDARYVAVLGGQPEFKKGMAAALAVCLLPQWEARIHELLDADSRRGRDRTECLESLNNLVRYYRNNAQRMKCRLFREHHFPIGSGAIESAHRHVLQTRMKRAGQHWAMRSARRMARLRAAYRTAGPVAVHGAIRRARRATVEHGALVRPRAAFRYSRQGRRDLASAARAASN